MRDGLVTNLELEGYEVACAEDGAKGLALAEEFTPELVILDLTLPVVDGYGVLRTLRERGARTPVLILSALGEEMNKVRGFRLGADDYVTKPFGLMELLARVQALLRRAGGSAAGAQDEGVHRFGDVEVELHTRRVSKAGREVQMAPREFDLLAALLTARGGIVSRLNLLTQVWGYRSAVLTRTVDSHVAELRRKLEDDPGAPRHILTVRKAGYRLQG
jgi:DNA-binding response OmpR family regulator